MEQNPCLQYQIDEDIKELNKLTKFAKADFSTLDPAIVQEGYYRLENMFFNIARILNRICNPIIKSKFNRGFVALLCYLWEENKFADPRIYKHPPLEMLLDLQESYWYAGRLWKDFTEITSKHDPEEDGIMSLSLALHMLKLGIYYGDGIGEPVI